MVPHLSGRRRRADRIRLTRRSLDTRMGYGEVGERSPAKDFSYVPNGTCEKDCQGEFATFSYFFYKNKRKGAVYAGEACINGPLSFIFIEKIRKKGKMRRRRRARVRIPHEVCGIRTRVTPSAGAHFTTKPTLLLRSNRFELLKRVALARFQGESLKPLGQLRSRCPRAFTILSYGTRTHRICQLSFYNFLLF